MREVTLCDICEGTDCSDTCEIRASGQQRSKSELRDDREELEKFASSTTQVLLCPLAFVVAVLNALFI